MFVLMTLSPTFSLFWLVGVCCFFCCAFSCKDTDKHALLKLKHDFADHEFGYLSTWKPEVDCCQWSGVSCSNLTGHVIELNLKAYALRGKIDSSLCDLRHLTYLNLNWNNFKGRNIPECIGSLGQLRELSISYTLIGGTIPRGLQNLSNLQTLHLVSNDLIVNDLEWISHLSSLRYLDLSYTDLSKAVDWQSSLSKAPLLSEIHLDGCSLISHVNPASFVHTNSSTSLKLLSLQKNSLNSSILPWLSNISKVLTHLDLSENTLEQIFPNALHINSLRVLDLGSNNLSQLSPKAFSNMNSLQYLDLSTNFLRHIPSNAFTNSTSLEVLDLIDNKLENSVTKSISNLCRLKILSLSDNNISDQLNDWIPQLGCAQNSVGILDLINNPFSSGPFPDFSRFSKLMALDLENMGLHGSIPQSFGHFPYLSTLSLRDNNLTGPLPVFAGFVSLKYLDLSNNRLNGTIHPNALRQLPNLVELDLSSNRLSIPQSFGHLPYLSKLNLRDNNLTGPLPVFTGLVSLNYLDLSNNRFNGTIHPNAFRQLPNLVELYLSSNRLNSVISETHLSTLSNLTSLDVSQNSISFNISSNWVPPFQLQTFSASSCNCGPHFPRWLKFQRELWVLDISDASISDSIPQWLWLNPLRHLNLSHNKLYGQLPKSLFNNISFALDLSFNNLSGPLPHFPLEAQVLLLSNNMFSGTISFICETIHEDLSYLDISSNVLSGRLPDCWGQLPSLVVLRLENNNFSGSIPNSVGTLEYLKSIHLNNNNLSGNLPSLMNSSDLLFIDFGQNNLDGELPSWIGRYLHKLVGLRLKANNLQGSIPTNLCNLPNLQILDLSRNNITGNIPRCFGNLGAMSNMTSIKQSISFSVDVNIGGSTSFMETTNLSWKGEDVEYSKILGLMKTIDLSCNHLTGEIPSSITTFVALASLNLSKNNLRGSIPVKMGNMTRLESLDLSNNSLSGEIPTSFSSLSFLSVLNLSFNNLWGKISTATQLQTFDASSYMGNQGLCGPPLAERCPTDEGSSDPNPNPSKNDGGDGDDNLISFGFYVSLALGFIVGFWGVCGTLILKHSWCHSFFHFFSNMNDWIYVRVAILRAKIKRRFQH